MERKKFERITTNQKEILKKLALEGKSLNEINKETGMPKTTIYYHVKKYKPRQWRSIIVRLSDNEIGELMGAFAGDGSYCLSMHGRSYHHKIRYSLSLLKDYKYALHLIRLLKKLNLNPHLCKKEKGNGLEVLVHSKPYLNFIREFLEWSGKKTYSVHLKKDVSKSNSDFLRGFARGLMDTDGFVEISNVSCGCTSKMLIKNLTEIFDKFEIRYKLTKRKREPNRRDLFLVRVYRDSLERYKDLIGFSNEYKSIALKKILK